jgi:NhaP-type Na+/H+ or K+/H+ antiporter
MLGQTVGHGGAEDEAPFQTLTSQLPFPGADIADLGMSREEFETKFVAAMRYALLIKAYDLCHNDPSAHNAHSTHADHVDSGQVGEEGQTHTTTESELGAGAGHTDPAEDQGRRILPEAEDICADLKDDGEKNCKCAALEAMQTAHFQITGMAAGSVVVSFIVTVSTELKGFVANSFSALKEDLTSEIVIQKHVCTPNISTSESIAECEAIEDLDTNTTCLALKVDNQSVCVYDDPLKHIVFTAGSGYLRIPAIEPLCVAKKCKHNEHGCEPRTCESKDCYPVPCTDDHAGHCFVISNPGFNASKVMCGDPPCIPVTCGHGERNCVPVVCGEEGGHSSDPCAQGHHGDDGLSFWPFLLMSLFIAIGLTAALDKLSNGACCGKSLNPPFTVLMFFIGYFVSSWVSHEHEIGKFLKESAESSHYLINSVDAWKATHPHVILFCLLPPLLFEDAASMEFYTFRKVLVSSIILAGPGVGLSMFATAGTSMALFGFENECATIPLESGHWMLAHEPELMDLDDGVEVCRDSLPIPVHLLLGGMLAATDPVAVCAVLNSLGCPDKLNYMIAGESLLNDGTAVVAFLVMQSVAGGCGTDAAHVLLALVRLAGGGLVFGLFMAACTYQFTKQVNNPNIEISAVVAATFFTFWYAENIAGVSGVLGTVVFGVQTARTSLLAMDEHSHHASHAFWSEVGYLATAMIFMVAGVASNEKINRFLDETTTTLDTDDGEFHVGHQISMNFVLYIILTFIRAAVVGAFAPILTKIGYGLTWKEAFVMVWGGLRGAVSLSLALLVDGNHLINERSRELIFMQTVGIVSLTLLINGSTSGMVYKALQVYPANPFRPLLATQGLRNLQLEIEKQVAKMKDHWFHGNADATTLSSLLPNFVEASMYDGDLVDVGLTSIHETWKNGITNSTAISPVRMGKGVAKVSQLFVENALKTLRVDYSSTELLEHHKEQTKRALEPDTYAQIGLSKGNFWAFKEIDVVPKTKDPVWPDVEMNTIKLKIPAGDETVFLYCHMLDNDIGDDDDYLGEAKLDITAMLASQIKTQRLATKTIQLGPCTHIVKKCEHKLPLPSAVSGSVTLKIDCDNSDGMISVTMVSGSDLGIGVTRGTNKNESGKVHALVEHEVHGDDHGEGDHGGHGHGDHDQVFLLQNVRRWIIEAQIETDNNKEVTAALPEFAMYEIMLSHMKNHFHHMREEDTISIASMSRLYSACGVGLDINNSNLDVISRASGAPSAKEFDVTSELNGANPLTAIVDYVADFCDNGAAGCSGFVPSQYFEHRYTCAEMLFCLIDSFKELVEVESDTDGFADAVTGGLNRLQKKLAEMQLAAPNAFKAVHTLIAFKHVAADFKHRLHSYADQGFFTETYVEAAEHCVNMRTRELGRYVNIDFMGQIVGLLTMNACNLDHPVVAAFKKDKSGDDPPTPVTPAGASGDTDTEANPVAGAAPGSE